MRIPCVKSFAWKTRGLSNDNDNDNHKSDVRLYSTSLQEIYFYYSCNELCARGGERWGQKKSPELRAVREKKKFTYTRQHTEMRGKLCREKQKAGENEKREWKINRQSLINILVLLVWHIHSTFTWKSEWGNSQAVEKNETKHKSIPRSFLTTFQSEISTQQWYTWCHWMSVDE